MSLRNRCVELLNIGGYDIIPGFEIMMHHGDLRIEVPGKDFFIGEFEDECLDDALFYETKKITENLVKSAESIVNIQYGVVISRNIECMSPEDGVECRCPVCENGHSDETIFHENVKFTEFNKKLYDKLSKKLGCDNVPNIVIEKLKEIYYDVKVNPLDTKYVIVLGNTIPSMMYKSERSRNLSDLYLEDIPDSFEEYLRVLFIRYSIGL